MHGEAGDVGEHACKTPQAGSHCPGSPSRSWGKAGAGRSKVFFFEKKKQKTFDPLGFGLSGWSEREVAKVFWCCFSKKNRFLIAKQGPEFERRCNRRSFCPSETEGSINRVKQHGRG
jgi:hypothetical protein